MPAFRSLAASSHMQAGFTLLEAMVTVVVIAILAAIALPAYSDYIKRGKLPDATGGLAAKQAQMEQYFQDNLKYTGAPACTADSTTSSNFNFSCPVQTDTTYTLQADGKGSMGGFSFSVDQSGTKTTVAVPSGWSLPSPNTCWVTKQGGVC